MRNILLFLTVISLSFSCKKHCHNGEKDKDEEGVDCGGKCWSCYPEVDPSVCETTPELFGKLYCLYPDTNGFSVNPPIDILERPMFFMHTGSTSETFIEVCNGTIVADEGNLYGSPSFAEISRWEMIENTSTGMYEYTYVGRTHFGESENCYYYPLSANLNLDCNWFTDGVRYQFVDYSDSIYILVHETNGPVEPTVPKTSVVDTIVYYHLY